MHGQEKFTPGWEFGVGFGPTFGTMSFDPAAPDMRLNSSYKNGFHGGVSARYVSEKNLGVIGELNYSQLGWKQDYGDNLQGFEYSRRLNYLEMPIMTHIYFGNKVRFFVNLGPKLGLIISETESFNDVLSNYLANITEDQKKGMVTEHYYRKAQTKFDYGLIGGLGMEFRTGIGSFSVEGRYSFGLGDIFKNSQTDDFSRSANRAFYARVTYYTKIF